jgi:uncharacterized integral membrane protein (TIGR00698 family)
MLPGIALSAVLGLAAMVLGNIPVLQSHGFSALTAAIVLGIVLGNSMYRRITSVAGPGVAFSKQNLLRAGVILYGLRLTLHDVGEVGIAGVLTDALVLSSTFVIAVTMGTRFFKLDRETSILIGAGSAICGAAAVMATEPVVRARADHVTVAISTVVVFGTAAMFLYPALYAWTDHGMSVEAARRFGVYTGSTIHEVAQVFAAGRAISENVANTAVITKMVRVMMLAPFLLGLSAWFRPNSDERSGHHRSSLNVPWFAVAFVGMVILNSLVSLPKDIVRIATSVDTLVLATAMAALGLTTHASALRAAGPKPLWLGALLLVWLVAGGGAINACVASLLHSY